jgi:hypothetical protein
VADLLALAGSATSPEFRLPMSTARMGESAIIENLLQGKWVKHPLPPAIVHIPVSMWITSLVFDFLVLSGSETELLSRLSVDALALGLVDASRGN